MRIKNLLRNRRGTAEIVGTVLFLVILLFFFSNVFLWHNQVSRETDQIIADKVNSPVKFEVTSGSSIPVQCIANPLVFGGFAASQGTPSNPNNPPKGGSYTNSAGPPYGKIMSGTGGGTDSYIDTRTKDGKYQVLIETGLWETSQTAECQYTNLNYICLNATYQFNVTVTKSEDLRLIEAIAIRFYGRSIDAEGEAVDVYLYNVQRRTFENTGLKILSALDWYNVTLENPGRYISVASGTKGIVKVNYLSDQQGFYCDEKQYGQLWIDYQDVSVSPLSLKISDLGGKDIRLERLWITDVSADNHIYIELAKVPDLLDNLKEVWLAAGSSVNINFGNATVYDEIQNVLTIDYQPPAGDLIFEVLTNLGNTATTEYPFPS